MNEANTASKKVIMQGQTKKERKDFDLDIFGDNDGIHSAQIRTEAVFRGYQARKNLSA